MWVVQFINTAVILVVINNQITGGIVGTVVKTTGTDGFLFDGQYSDFTSSWYGVVGITIFTTAFINGITPVGDLYKWCLGSFKRFCDRGCSGDKKKTRKQLQ